MREGLFKGMVARPAAAGRTAVYAARGVRWHGLATVLGIFCLNRLAFYLVACAATWLLPQGGTPPIIADVTSRAVLMMHWRWDAIHYYSIATGGYNAYVNQPLPGTEPDMLLAFFPLFPLLIHGVAMLLGGLHSPAFVPIGEAATAPLLAGVLVVNAATLLAFWLLYQLVYEETADDAMAERTVFYVAFFPLAFFYAVPYAEPLFLAASVGTFLAARRRHWVRAGVWIAVAAAARPFGILLGPVLALEMLLAWRRGELPRKDWSRAVLGLIIAPQGLVLFMLYLWWQLGDPFAFVQAQQSFWNREPVFPLVTLWRGIGYTLFPDWSTQPDTYGRTVLHTLTILLFLGGLIISLRRWRPTYVFYGVLLFIQILAVPWPGETVMHTLGRSAMVFFPVYMLLARWGARPAVHQAIMTIWLPLFGLFTAMYVLFYFVG